MVCVYPVALSGANVNFAWFPFEDGSELGNFVEVFNREHKTSVAVLKNEEYGKNAVRAKTYATLMFEYESDSDRFVETVRSNGWPVEAFDIFSEKMEELLNGLACRAERMSLEKIAQKPSMALSPAKKQL